MRSKILTFKIVVLTSATLCAVAAPFAAAAPVSFKLNHEGLVSLQYRGNEFINAHSGGPKGIFFAGPWPANDSHESGGYRSSVLAEDDTVRQTYSWGEASCHYSVEGNDLKLAIRVTNRSSQTISQVQLSLGEIAFPNHATPNGWQNSAPPGADNYKTPTILIGDYGTGALALVDEKVSQREWTQWMSRYWSAYPIRVTSGNDVAPGASEDFALSLRFGNSGDNRQTLAGDVWLAFQELRPQTLSWPDRRPIGSVALAAVNRGYKTNPRGWFNESSLNVFTAAGKEQFHQHLQYLANATVQNVKAMNAQGIIVWDIEGEQYMQGPGTFIGDPTKVKQFAPEMDLYADEFFRTIHSQGIRVGVLLRPQEVVPWSKGGYTHREYATNDEIVAAMAARVTYSKNRWGCTLFYVDTNGGAKGLYDSVIFKRLNEIHPDCLFIPEAQDNSYYAYSAPYDELRTLTGIASTSETGATARALYPGGFTVINTPDGDLKGKHNDLVNAVRRGDVLMFRSWFRAPEFKAV